MRSSYVLLFLSIILLGCESTTPDRKASVYRTTNKKIQHNTEKNNWHLLDIENDTLPGISLSRMIDNFKIESNNSIIAVLDTPFDIHNDTLKKYLWKNKMEIIDGVDNDQNGFIDDRNGWNFLGDTLGNTVLFNQFECSRITSNTELSIDKQTYNRALDKYNSELKLANSVMEQTPFLLGQLRKQLRHPALPDEKDITISYLDSLTKYNIVKKEEISLVIRAKEFDLTLSKLQQDSLNYARYLNYYLNTDYNDRSSLKNYTGQLDKLSHGNNFVDKNLDILYHGTKTSGVIAIALEAFAEKLESIQIMPIVISNYGDEHDIDIIAAIRYAVDNGAKVINMSSSKEFSSYSYKVIEELNDIAKKDILFITSAGNNNFNLDNKDYFNFPNDLELNSNKELLSNLIKVGASTDDIKQLKFPQSNYGKEQVDLFAPGVNINSLTSRKARGTSGATPQVSLIAALLFSQFPSLSATEVKQILMDSSVKYDLLVDVPTKENPDQKLPFSELSKSGGIVNAYNAMIMGEEYVKKKK